MLDHSPYALDQTPSQCFGKAIFQDFPNADSIPKWRFSRWYFGRRIIVDCFTTQKAYDSAEVEARRAMAKRHDFAYAALGPQHSRFPHKDAKMREKYPSLVEQLGMGE